MHHDLNAVEGVALWVVIANHATVGDFPPVVPLIVQIELNDQT
jgi:hypothetical protein